MRRISRGSAFVPRFRNGVVRLVGKTDCRLLSRCPEPYREGMWDKARSPLQRVAIPSGQDSLPTVLTATMDRYASPWCKNSPPPRALTTDALPKAPQRLRLGP